MANEFKVKNGLLVSGDIGATGSIYIGLTGSSGYRLDVNGTSRFSSDSLINGVTIGKGNGSRPNNTALGTEVLQSVSTNFPNTAVGWRALRDSVSGGFNVAVGSQSLTRNVTGSGNSAIGHNSLGANDGGSDNTAAGSSALGFNTQGNSNSAFGSSSLLVNSTGSNNTAVGYESGRSNATGTGNVFIGYQSGYNELGSNKLYIANNSTSPLIYGDFSTGNLTIGSTADAGFRLDVSGSARITNGLTITGSLTTSQDILVNSITVGRGGGNDIQSVALGSGALGSNITGMFNTAVGYLSLFSNTSGGTNTALGILSLVSNTTGNGNVSIGSDSMNQNISGSENVSIGNESLAFNITGNRNVAVGRDTLRFNTANNNTAIGYSAGESNTTGVNNIFIGYQSTGVSATGSNRTWIGNSSTTSTWLAGNVLIGTTTDAGFKLDVSGSARITNGLTITGSLTTSQNIQVNGITVGRSPGALESTNHNIALGVNNYSSYSGNSRAHVAIGYNAFRDLTSGYYSIAIGGYALQKATDPDEVIGIGFDALGNATTASYTLAIGNGSLFSDTDGFGNTAVGHYTGTALQSSLGGYGNNTFLGSRAARDLKNSQESIAIGPAALQGSSSGNNLSSGNIAIGPFTALNWVSGSNNTWLGYNTNGFRSGSFNTIIGGNLPDNAIGSNTTLNNSVILADGNGSIRLFSPSSTNVLIGTTTDAGFKLDVNGTLRTTSIATLGGIVAQRSDTNEAILQLVQNPSGNSNMIYSNGDGYLGWKGRTAGGSLRWVFESDPTTESGRNFSIFVYDSAGLNPVQVFKATRTLFYTTNLQVTGTATVSSTLTANSFVKSGGTSSQFLKADGSVDSNTYLSSIPTLAQVTTAGNTTTNGITVGASIIDTLNVGRGTGGIATNTVLGFQALNSNTTGFNNVALGYQPLFSNTTGRGIAIGSYSLYSNTSGRHNIGIGENSLYNNTTGWDNVAIGRDALSSSTIGDGNTAIGNYALLTLTSGNNNTAIGLESLQNTTGNDNIGIGQLAGQNNSSGSNNIFIGTGINGASPTQSNRTWIGTATTTSTWLAGNVLIGTTTDAGFKLDVNGTARVSGNLTVDTNTLFVDSVNDRVGIGTVTPTANLQINSSTNVNVLALGNPTLLAGQSGIYTDTQSVFSFGNNPGGVANFIGNFNGFTALMIKKISTGGGHYLDVRNSSNQNLLLFTTTGNLLINTGTDAGYRLDVNGTARISNLIYTDTVNGRVGINTASPNYSFEVVSNNGKALFRSNAEAQDIGLYFSTPFTPNNPPRAAIIGKALNNWNRIDLYFCSNNVVGSNPEVTTADARMVIQAAGNVGIGTASPEVKLHVAGVVLSADSSGYGFYTGKRNNHITQNAYFNGTNWLSYGSTATFGSAIILQTAGDQGNAFDISVDTSISAANEALVFTNLMRVKTNGNVLINTTTDSGYKLDVNGTLRSANDAYFATASGNVGIGTTAPAKNLTINKTNSSLEVRTTGENQSASLFLGTPVDGNGPSKAAIIAEGISSWSRSKLHFCLENTISNSGSSEANLSHSKMVITREGNVGIGTTNPLSLLQIGNNNTDSGSLFRFNLSYDINRSSRGGLTWSDPTNITGKIHTEYDGTMVSMVFGSLYNNGYNSNNLVAIRGNGHVGIGTTSPRKNLTINSNNSSLEVRATAENQSAFLFLGTPVDENAPSKAAIIAEGVNSWSRSKLLFCLEDTTSNATSAEVNVSHAKMVITKEGNVGIGTTGPSYRLDTNGSIRSTSDSYFATTSGNVGIGTTTPGHKLDISGNLRTTTSAFFATSSGGVGIGTTSPTANLDVDGGARVRIDLQVDRRLYVTDFLYVGTTTFSGYKLDINGVARFTSDVYAAGNVGIGTITPGAKLDINRGTATNNTIALRIADSASSLIFVPTTGTGGYNSASITGSYGIFASPDSDFVIGQQNGSAIKIQGSDKRIQFFGSQTGNNVSLLQMTLVGSTGNFLIGTTSDAGYRLDVNGTLRSANDAYFATTSGNVGIGTTSPSSLLHIQQVAPILTIKGTGSGEFGMRILDNSSVTLGGLTYSSVTGEQRLNGEQFYVYQTIYTGGLERLRITTAGNIGVGTTSPAGNLHIIGQQANTSSTSVSNPTGTLILAYPSGTANNQFGSSIVFTQRWNDSSTNEIAMGQITGVKLSPNGWFGGGLTFWTSDGSSNALAERMRINQLGHIGIGTISPTDTNSYGRALDIQSNAGAAAYFRDSDDTSKYFLSGFVGQTTNHGVIGTWGTGTLLRLFTSGDERMRIFSGGNVAINTTTDSGYRLDVNGTARIQGSNSTLLLQGTNVSILSFNSPSGLGTISTYNDNTLRIGAQDNANTNHLVISSSGNVGIGTITPTRKLDVSGSVNATEYIAQGVTGYTGVLVIPGNPIGSQNITITGGIITAIN